ncbi:MAG TPA: hypothetical protein VND80_09800 [Steroidobacteraceae bacterium]|nr:hypothetical protein [Steroidobacteraceae bacterium]
MLTWADAGTNLSPEVWQQTAPSTQGSWWPSWQAWLAAHSSPVQVAPRVPGDAAAGFPALADAPGEYVRQG